MDQASTAVSIEIAPADLADLQEWARNSERSVADLLQEALRHYLEYTRAEDAMFEEARKGPFSSLEDVRARLAASRDARAQAAE